MKHWQLIAANTSVILRRFCLKQHSLPVLTLYTKYPCPLCDEAKENLKPLLHMVRLEEVDITLPENKHWWTKYKYDIPVFHLNGKFLMKHKGDPDVLKNALSSESDIK